MKVDRSKFWKLYHKGFDAYGPTTQATVDALNDILDRFETETRLKGISHYSYTLATSFHETGVGGNHFVPVKEGRERASSPRRANQDRYWKTGFYGRGQTQTTWEENYRKLGKALGVGELFVQNPDLLLTAKWSYESLVYGLSSGMYRSDSKGKKSLSRYLKGDDASLQDYVNARDVVNGDIKKNGLLIANYAEKFENILTQSQISTAHPQSSASGNDVIKPADETPKQEAQTEPSKPPTETTYTQEKGDTKVEIAAKNEQDVTETVTQPGPVPYNDIGLKETLKKDAKSVLPANFGLQTISEYIQQTTGWPEWVTALVTKAALIALIASVVWVLYRLISYGLHHWRENERQKLMAYINTDITRKDLVIEDSKVVKPPVAEVPNSDVVEGE